MFTAEFQQRSGQSGVDEQDLPGTVESRLYLSQKTKTTFANFVCTWNLALRRSLTSKFTTFLTIPQKLETPLSGT